MTDESIFVEAPVKSVVEKNLKARIRWKLERLNGSRTHVVARATEGGYRLRIWIGSEERTADDWVREVIPKRRAEIKIWDWR